MNYWLVKSDPETYDWQQFEKDKKTCWDGVRNYQARNNLALMKKGDIVLWYHSNFGKDIVGIAKLTKETFQDPTTQDERWLAVELSIYKKLKLPVSLEIIKTEKILQNLSLLKQQRLSVMPVTKIEFETILSLGETKL